MGLTQRELCRETQQWYALTVRHQHERTAKAALQSKRLDTLVPSYEVRNRWSDRDKALTLPLFSGYVFCRFDNADRVTVLNTPGVRGIVGFGGRAAAIDAREIEAIERMSASGVALSPWPYLKPGDAVRVERGPLRGMMGTLIREKDKCRLVIGVELLQRSIAAEVALEEIVPIAKVRAVGV